ncbi:unnamed protein product [Didymodactylos carnosus]|uniref:Metallo-beta-lactamase domain-containing protein n=1 Tax=Didymodactylos carnosus TaxID=1234261 RepID=A0A814E8F0_9BILA|nr:unnamed protein product [Didymodactylos carnosus]CAF1181140.1 unnamed protein product [Didymodactylos carnosus]CAF3739612.1 unnamed protein product [Didymodactylos carnosus]CAF3992372.1 unnamed protein product [Didymodactylos carnosus]
MIISYSTIHSRTAISNSFLHLFTQAVIDGIPNNAKGPAIPAKGYLVQHIRGGVYWLIGGAYQTMFMVSNEGVIAIDAPPAIGKNYLKAISEVTDKVVTHVVYSHDHLDHIGSAGNFPKDAVYVAHRLVAKSLSVAKAAAQNTSSLPTVPSRTFRKKLLLIVGNQTLHLDYHGINHSPGNTFIYAPKQKVLMLCDVVYPGWFPFDELAYARDIAGFIKAHDTILTYDFQTFIGGHVSRLGTRRDVEVQKDYVSDLHSAAHQALNGTRLAHSSIDSWKDKTEFLKAAEQFCLKIMLRKNWTKKLGGSSILPSNCHKMIMATRIEPLVAVT